MNEHVGTAIESHLNDKNTDEHGLTRTGTFDGERVGTKERSDGEDTGAKSAHESAGIAESERRQGRQRVTGTYVIVDTARKLTSRVLVGFSCGKDSVATLSLCHERFEQVGAYFMYLVKGLEFQEEYLRYAEKLFGLKIMRVPHWAIGDLYRTASFAPYTRVRLDAPDLKEIECLAAVRAEAGIEWIATGQRANESFHRAALMHECGGIDMKRRRFYPLAWWTGRQVAAYLMWKRIGVAPEYEVMARSWCTDLGGSALAEMKRVFPADYGRVRREFPFVEAAVKQYEMEREKKDEGERMKAEVRAEESELPSASSFILESEGSRVSSRVKGAV